MKPVSWTMWLFASVVLLSGCTQGSITTGDEPVETEEEAVDPDGGDEGPIDAGGDVADDGDPAGEDGDAAREDDMQGDDGQGDDGQGDDGQGDDGSWQDEDVQVDDGPGPTSEMLLFDGDGRQFTHADNGFHVLINPGDALPADNWLEPADYYNGEFHVRYVINAPPDQGAGRLQTCIWTMGDDGVGGNYFPESCGQQVSHTGVGEYQVTNNLSPADWWKKDGVSLDYSHPERFLIRVVLRGSSGCNVTRHDVPGACWEDEWPTFENMVFRVTIVMVGAGDSFSGWANYP